MVAEPLVDLPPRLIWFRIVALATIRTLLFIST